MSVCPSIWPSCLILALVFAIGELSGLLKEGLKAAQKQLMYPKVHTDVVKGAGDERLFRVSLSFDVTKAKIVAEVPSS